MRKLILSNVFQNYFGGETDTLHDISTEFCSGLNVVYAPEGGGKTTLLKIIAGLEKYRGKITLDQTPLADKIRDRDVLMVFDDYALRPHKSGRYNLEYPLKLRGTPVSEIQSACDGVIKDFLIGNAILDNTPHHMSKSERCRLAIARAFLREAPIKLFDNPFGGLNPDERRELFLLLMSRISRETESIIVYATDSAEEAALINGKTVVLSYGWLVGEGLPSVMSQQPSCLCIAEKFIRWSSSYDGELSENGYLIFSDFAVAFPTERLVSPRYCGSKVIVCAPYSAFSLQDNGVEGIINNVMNADGRYFASVKTQSDSLYLVSDCPTVGATVNVAVDAAKLLLFDPINERSIIDYENA